MPRTASQTRKRTEYVSLVAHFSFAKTRYTGKQFLEEKKKRGRFENRRFPLSPSARYFRVADVPTKNLSHRDAEESEGYKRLFAKRFRCRNKPLNTSDEAKREEGIFALSIRVESAKSSQVPGEILSSIEREKSVTGRGKQNGGLYPCPRTEEGLGIVSVHCFPNKRRPRCFVRRYVQPDRQDEQEMDCCQFYSS